MSPIPAFEIGVWNAWILMLYFPLHPLLFLVVDKLVATSSQVTVIIRNASRTVADAFWVDVYFNPSPTPTLTGRGIPLLRRARCGWPRRFCPN